MSDFDGIEDAESTRRSNYVLPGTYPILFVQALKKIRSQQTGDKLFIAEFDIIESKVPERPPGMDMSSIFNITKHGKTALGNIKGLIAACLDVPEEKVDSKTADLAVSSDNPFHGRLVRCEAVQVTTRAGQPFTKPNYYPLPEDLQKRALELHQRAGFGSTMPPPGEVPGSSMDYGPPPMTDDIPF